MCEIENGKMYEQEKREAKRIIREAMENGCLTGEEEEAMEDLKTAEKLCERMEPLPDIWQNAVIRAVCQLQRRQLVREIKRERRNRKR